MSKAHKGPQLKFTRDLGIFMPHEHNRPIHDDPQLKQSMKKHGFMPSTPLQVVPAGNGLFKVVRGHHRLRYAKELGIGVWYVVDESNVDIFDLEGGRPLWSHSDFARARANAGDQDVRRVLDFQKKHGLTLGVAASLLGGECAGSQNKVAAIKRGTFGIAADTTHAAIVVSITDLCRDCKIDFATQAAFVGAISKIAKVPEFDIAVFKHRLRMHGSMLQRHTTTDRYLEALDDLYNYGAKGRRIPLAFRAREESRKRQLPPGGKPKRTVASAVGAVAR